MPLCIRFYNQCCLVYEPPFAEQSDMSYYIVAVTITIAGLLFLLDRHPVSVPGYYVLPFSKEYFYIFFLQEFRFYGILFNEIAFIVPFTL